MKRSCWICGKDYDYCPHCKRAETWKSTTCSTEHYQIHLILQELREGVLTKIEAKQRLKNIGIDNNYNFDKMIPAVARDVKEIIKTKEKTGNHKITDKTL